MKYYYRFSFNGEKKARCTEIRVSSPRDLGLQIMSFNSLWVIFIKFFSLAHQLTCEKSTKEFSILFSELSNTSTDFLQRQIIFGMVTIKWHTWNSKQQKYYNKHTSFLLSVRSLKMLSKNEQKTSEKNKRQTTFFSSLQKSEMVLAVALYSLIFHSISNNQNPKS